MPLKPLLFSLSFIIATCCVAQFKKGAKLLGTSVASGFISTGKTIYSFPNGTGGYTSNQNLFNLNINPSIGWFLNHKCVVGAQLAINKSNQKTWLESAANGNTYKRDNYRNTDIGAGGFFRYFFKTGKGWNPFTHVYVNGGSGNTKTDGFYYATNYTNDYEGESSSRFFYNAGMNIGVLRMISDAVGIEGFAGYVHSYNKFTTTTRSVTNDNGTILNSEYAPTQKFTGNGVNLGIGLQVFVGKK